MNKKRIGSRTQVKGRRQTSLKTQHKKLKRGKHGPHRKQTEDDSHLYLLLYM
jgi:hypothetical protein